MSPIPLKFDRTFFRIGKDGLVYGAASVITAALGLVIMTATTRMVTPAEYGTIELFRVITQFVGFVMVMGMDMAQTYFFFKTNEAEAGSSRSSMIGALLQFRVLWGLICAASVGILLPWVLTAHGIDSVISNAQIFWALAWCWATGVLLIPLTYYRSSSQPFRFGTFSILHTLLAGGFAVAGMLMLADPVTGYLAGFGCASLVIVVAMIFLLRKRAMFWPLQTQWWERFLRFGLPFLCSAPFLFGLQSADRWFILNHLGRGELGVYAVGAQFATIVGGAVTVFITAWEPVAMSKLDGEDGPRFFRTAARLYLGGFSAVAVCLTAVLPAIMGWFTTDAYGGSSTVAQILIWTPILHGFFYLAIGGVWKRQKTVWVTALMGGAFFVNIAANGFAVPRWGIAGGALASVSAFAVMAFSALWLSERLWKIHSPVIIFVIQLALGFAASFLMIWMESLGVGLFLRGVVALAVFCALTVVTLHDRIFGVQK